MIAFVLATLLSIPYRHAPAARVMPPSNCAQYLRDSCRNWKIATWLPSLEPGNHTVHPTTLPFVDEFISEYGGLNDNALARSQGSPTTGTAFSYGMAGPPQGMALYDSRKHIAFYGEGCCSWHTAVLAAGVGTPPVAVEDRPLRGIRTRHGLYLGMALGWSTGSYDKGGRGVRAGRLNLQS